MKLTFFYFLILFNISVFSNEYQDNLFKIKVTENYDTFYGFKNYKDEIVVPAIYEDATEYNNGFAWVKKVNVWMIIDSKGNIIKEFPAEKAKEFSCGISRIKLDNKWIFVNTKGEKITQKSFEEADDFKNGYAVAYYKGKAGLIDIKGNIKVPFNFYNLAIENKIISLFKDNKIYGYTFIREDSIVNPVIYDELTWFRDECAIATKDLKKRLIDKNGKDLIFADEIEYKDGLYKITKLNTTYYFYYNKISTDYKFAMSDLNKAIFEFKNKKEQEKLRIKKEKYKEELKLNLESDILAKIEEKKIDFENTLKQGEYEKKSDYLKRIGSEFEIQERYKKELEAYRAEATKIVYDKYIKQYYNKVFSDYTISKYDPENETFTILGDDSTYVIVKVPNDKARQFKEIGKLEFNNIKANLTEKGWQLLFCDVSNTILSSDKFSFDIANLPNYEEIKPLTLAINIPEIRLDPVNIEVKNSIAEVKQEKKSEIDVDIDIPSVNSTNMKGFAVVIGNESYKNEIKVDYALNDAKVVRNYFSKTFGLPDNNIHYIENATFGQVFKEIEWLNNVAKAYNGEANIYFYYAGHGIPDEQTKSAYILPTDGSATIPQTACKLEELFSKLSQYPTKSTMVFLDACFSGAAREGMLAKGRGVVIRPKGEVLKGNLVVLSATSEDETAFPYSDKQHGLFTYFLLKKIKETKGEVSLSELAEYVKSSVNQQSVVVNKKPQTPRLNVSQDIINDLDKIKLR